MLIDVTRDGDEIGEHRITDRARNGGVGQRIKPYINDPLISDHVHPLENRPRFGFILVIRGDEFGDIAGCELLHQWSNGTDDFVEVGLVVFKRRDQTVEDRIVEVLTLDIAHQRDSFDVSATQRSGKVTFTGLAELRVYLRFPIRRTVPGEIVSRVLHEQWLDIVDVASDLLVVGAPFKRDQRPRDDIHKAPRELLERCRIAFAGQLIRDPGRHFRDPREIADRVVAGGHLGEPEVEQREIPGAACAPRFHVNPPQ